MRNIMVEQLKFKIDHFPDKCPLWHNGIEPKNVAAVVLANYPTGRQRIELAFQCPRKDWRRILIGTYAGTSGHGVPSVTLHLKWTAPRGRTVRIIAERPRVAGSRTRPKKLRGWGR